MGVAAEILLAGTFPRLSPGRTDVQLEPRVVLPVQDGAHHVGCHELSHRHCAAY